MPTSRVKVRDYVDQAIMQWRHQIMNYRAFTYVNSEENNLFLHVVTVFRSDRSLVYQPHIAPHPETSFGDLASGVYVFRMFDGGDTTERFHGRAPINGAASDAHGRPEVISIRLKRGNNRKVTDEIKISSGTVNNTSDVSWTD